jgi:hypothetical protein
MSGPSTFTELSDEIPGISGGNFLRLKEYPFGSFFLSTH